MRRLTGLLLLLACGACATTGVRPEGPKVLSLEIEGTEEVKAREVKDKILTSGPPWYKKLLPWLPFGEEPRFDRNAWRSDLRRITRYYQARGFYDAAVVSDHVLAPDGRALPPGAELPDAVRLTVEVREGEPTVVHDVQVNGLESLPADLRMRVLHRLPLGKGDVFVESQWNALKSRLVDRLREEGYAEAELEAEALIDVATREADLRLEVDPGRQYTFGRIFVSDAPDAVVAPSRIIDQARSVIDEGQVYSETALAEAQSKVLMMGVFGAVKVNRGLVNRDAGTVPVVIEVREAPFHSVRAGAGLGVEAFRTELRLLGEYVNRDFLGGLRRLNLTGRVGYAWAANIIDALFNQSISLTRVPNGLIFDLNAQLEQPRILFQDVSGRFELQAERGVEPAYTYLGGRIELGFAWRPTGRFSFRPSIVFEGYQIDGTPGLTGLGTAGSASSANVALGCPSGELSCFVPLNYLEQVFEYDKRNNPVAPTSGYYLSLSLQEGGGPLSDYAFLRVLPEARAYYSPVPNEGLTLAMRLRGGTLVTFATGGNPAGVSPIVSRFFAGGPSSMRGFSSGRLSPLQLVLDTPPGEAPPPPETEAPGGEDGERLLRQRTLVPLGGNGLLDTSLEARYRIGTSDFAVASFVDAGIVTAQSFGTVGEGCSGSSFRECAGSRTDLGTYLRSNLLTAVGVGLRYLTVVGPIRLDFAYRLPMGPPLPVSSGDYFYSYDTSCFGFGRNRSAKGTLPNGYGGAPEGRCVVHLSVGEAF